MVHLTTALDASSGVPLYEQLYRSLAGEMRSGTLAAAPDARQAAAGGRAVRLGEYGGCRLSDAGGGRVSGIAGAQRLLCTGISGPASRPAGGPEQPAPPKPEPPVLPVRYDLSTRGVDPELFPFRTWARLQKELLYSSPQLLTHGDAQGDPALRQALAEYLSEYAVCSAGRIRSWWARDWNTCWACWHRCCPALQRWKRRATPVLCRCCRTTVCTAAAYRWTRTAFRWKH